MVDPAIADLSGWQAIAINLGAMLLGWLIYDQLVGLFWAAQRLDAVLVHRCITIVAWGWVNF